MVILLAELLDQRGFEVRILSRGYGRRSRVIQRVDPAGSASQFGDEPLMMARRLVRSANGASVWVGADRHRAGRKSEKDDRPGAKVVYLLDDGFQHSKLDRDIDVVLLTRSDLEDTLLPLGNLREPLRAMRRADVIVLRDDEGFVGGISGKAATWFIQRTLHLAENPPARPLAFCALARPEGFFAMLAEAGVAAAVTRAFRDHHAYLPRDIEGLILLARARGADAFVTTEKDAVKLTPAMIERLHAVGPVLIAELRVELVGHRGQIDELIQRFETGSFAAP
jgi:tetraacyldisaccharide 4'-kinase